MDETEIKHVVEAALLAAGRPLTLERIGELFAAKGGGPDRATLKRILDTLAGDYQGRGIELKEVATGYRVQVKGAMSDWLQPLWEDRAPRYTRALLETLALVAYRQPITRAEIEEVRGVVVSTNIVRTLARAQLDSRRRTPRCSRQACDVRDDQGVPRLLRSEEARRAADARGDQGRPAGAESAGGPHRVAGGGRTAASRPCSRRTTSRWPEPR